MQALKDVDARDKRGHDGEGDATEICCGAWSDAASSVNFLSHPKSGLPELGI